MNYKFRKCIALVLASVSLASSFVYSSSVKAATESLVAVSGDLSITGPLNGSRSKAVKLNVSSKGTHTLELKCSQLYDNEYITVYVRKSDDRNTFINDSLSFSEEKGIDSSETSAIKDMYYNGSIVTQWTFNTGNCTSTRTIRFNTTGASDDYYLHYDVGNFSTNYDASRTVSLDYTFKEYKVRQEESAKDYEEYLKEQEEARKKAEEEAKKAEEEAKKKAEEALLAQGLQTDITYNDLITTVPIIKDNGDYSVQVTKTINKGMNGVVFPIYIPNAGVVRIDVSSIADLSNAKVGLYKEKQCKNIVGEELTLSTEKNVKNWLFVPVTVSGTYYIKVYSSSLQKEYDISSTMFVELYTNNVNNTSANKEFYIGSAEDEIISVPIYTNGKGILKIKPVIYSDGSVGKVTLTDTSGELLKSTSKDTIVQAVKSDVYFLEFQNYENSIATVKYSFSNVVDYATKTKKNAVFIEDYTSYKGTINDTKWRYYKIKNTKSKKRLVVLIDDYCQGENDFMYIALFNKKGKLLKETKPLTYGDSGKLVYTNLPKGTYYIGIQCPYEGTSGYYTLKWK